MAWQISSGKDPSSSGFLVLQSLGKQVCTCMMHLQEVSIDMGKYSIYTCEV